MSNEIAVSEVPQGYLVPQDIFSAPSKFGDDQVFQGMSGGDYLPRIQLCAALTKVVKAKKANDGDFIVIKGKEDIVRNFGEGPLNVIIISWRPKALTFNAPGGKTKGYYNPKSPKFQEVERKANTKVKGELYGPEYLVYIPDIDLIASFHFNNPTMRMRAGDMRDRIGRAASITRTLIDHAGNQWYGPVINDPSVPLALPEQGTEEAEALYARFRTAGEKFRNPPDEMEEQGGAEAVTEPSASGPPQ